MKNQIYQIDKEVLYKTEPINIGEQSLTLYFDNDKILRKTKIIYYDDNYESCWTYYDSTGIAIYTSYYAWSMNGAYSIERYLDNMGNLLYVNHIGKQDLQSLNSIEPFIQEQIIRRKSSNAVTPFIDDVFYDKVSTLNDLKSIVVEYIDNVEITKPEKTQDVRFVSPSKGDTTSLYQNDVYIYAKPSLNSRIKDKVHICRNIIILDRIKEWYKISLTNPWQVKIEGYNHKDFLAPVKREVK